MPDGSSAGRPTVRLLESLPSSACGAMPSAVMAEADEELCRVRAVGALHDDADRRVGEADDRIDAGAEAERKALAGIVAELRRGDEADEGLALPGAATASAAAEIRIRQERAVGGKCCDEGLAWRCRGRFPASAVLAS